MHFSGSLVASYNKNPTRIEGLEQHLAPYIALDTVNNIYVLDSARLTVENERVIKALIEDTTPENSVFDMV